MTIVNTVLLSGWFQLLLLGTLFLVYSSRILKAHIYRGYALGWMIGLFFIFVYAALNPRPALQFGAYDGELNIFQIFIAGTMGLFVSLVLSILTHFFPNNQVRLSLATAAVTGLFVVAIFMQVIGQPDIRVMVSLFILAFGAVALTTNIIMARRQNSLPPPEAELAPPIEEASSELPSRLTEIRQRMEARRNNYNISANSHR